MIVNLLLCVLIGILLWQEVKNGSIKMFPTIKTRLTMDIELTAQGSYQCVGGLLSLESRLKDLEVCQQGLQNKICKKEMLW